MLSEPSSEVLGALMQPAVQTKAPPDTRPTHGFLRIAEEQASETWGLVFWVFARSGVLLSPQPSDFYPCPGTALPYHSPSTLFGAGTLVSSPISPWPWPSQPQECLAGPPSLVFVTLYRLLSLGIWVL